MTDTDREETSVTTTNWTIEPLCFGEFPTVEKSGFTFFRDQGTKISSAAISFLLRSGELKVLVDTGPVDPTEEHHPSHTPLRRTDEQTPQAALAAAGLAPEDLDLIVLTHLHYDHAHNLEAFPSATYVVQAEEARAAADPISAQKSMYEFAIPGVIPPWMRVTDRLRYVHGDTQLLPGLRLLHLPGHTPGMQGVLIDTAAGQYVLASDLVSLYENLGTDSAPWSVPGIHTDVYACERSLERLRALDATILPSHDWKVLEHKIYPPEAGSEG